MTFPRPPHVLVLTGYNGTPLDPQPETLSLAEAAKGIVGRWPNGTEKHVCPPTAVSSNTAERLAILAKLAELDAVTMHRAMEAWAKVHGDPFIKQKIAEKEALREQLAALS
jgi:hypothetical protein